MAELRTVPDYPRFLARAVRGLVSSGAQILLSSDMPALDRAPWTLGWDSIILVDQPGAAALYAFTNGDGRSIQELRARLDALAGGIARGGLMRAPSFKMVAVVVYHDGLSGVPSRSVTSLSPSTYFSGLRPAVWAVDLREGRVLTGSLQRGEAKGILLAAAQGVETGNADSIADGPGVADLARAHSERMDSFYAVMRGHQPIVTYGLMAINIGIFLLLYANGGPTNDVTLRDFGALSPRLIEQGQWWRLFTAMFLHAGIPHIVFNMTSLFAVGTLAERLYGNSRYLAIYLGAGLIGSLTSFFYSVATNNLDILGVGASGAIFGVAGALLTVRFQSSDVIPRVLRNRISTSLLPLIALSLVFSFLTPNVDNRAHIGGLLGGMALSFIFPVVKRAPGRS